MTDPNAEPTAPEPSAAEGAPSPSTVTGLGDMGRGLEVGFWATCLVSVPVACLLLGASSAMLPYTGLNATALLGLAVFALRWAGLCLVWGAPFAIPAALIAWLYRGIAARIGRPRPVPSARRRRRRWVFVAGLGVVGFVAGVAGGSLLINRAFRNQEEMIAETDAVDSDWWLDDLMATREEVPDEENSALVAAEVVSMLPEDWPPRSPKGTPPESDVTAAWDRATKTEPFRRLDDATADLLRADLESRREVVDLARTLADYDRGRHEWELGPALIDTLLPESQDARLVARLLQGDASLSAQDGRLDEALASCRAMFGTARSIGDEPFLIGQIVAIAIDSAAAQTARRVLAQGEPSDEALATLQNLASDERGRPRMEYGLRGERAVNAEIIRRIGEGEMAFSALSGAKGPDGGPPPGQPVNWLTMVGSAHQLAVLLRWMNDLLATFTLPEHEWRGAIEAWDSKLDETKRSRFGMYTSTLPLLLLPGVGAAVTAELRIRAELGSLVVVLAAERHRRAHGAWPTSIDAIDPEILPDPPLDPYGGGKPFRMEHVDGVLRVYSIGPNGWDEHGSYNPRTWPRGPADDDVGAFAFDPDRRGLPPAENGEMEEAAPTP